MKLICLLFSLQIIALGLVIYGAFSAYLIFISNSNEVMRNFGTAIPALLIVALGFLLFIFVFVGCCGLCRESTCCMETVSYHLFFKYSWIILWFATVTANDCNTNISIVTFCWVISRNCDDCYTCIGSNELKSW